MTARIVSAVPVPFLADGTVDGDTFDATLEAIAPHVGGALIAGTTGEFPALEDDERIDLFRRAAAGLGAERVIAHLGHASSRQVLRLADRTAEIGIHRFALLTPYYLPTDDDGVVDFFRALSAARPEAQVYAYLFPERTGLHVEPETLRRIMALPGVVGVKLSGAAAARHADYAAVLEDGQELYSGDDGTLPQVLAAGGTGVVSGVSSAFPETFATLAAALDGQDPDAGRLQDVVRRIVALVGPTVPRLKAALSARSGAEWCSRMSLPAVDEETRSDIRAVVAEHR